MTREPENAPSSLNFRESDHALIRCTLAGENGAFEMLGRYCRSVLDPG